MTVAGIGCRKGATASQIDAAIDAALDQAGCTSLSLIATSDGKDREGGLVEAARGVPGTSTPIPGFGSSDCRTCEAHLLAVPPDIDLAALATERGGPVPT